MPGAKNKIKRDPAPEPIVSTAWWNNSAFHTTMGTLRWLVRGTLAGVAAFVCCAMSPVLAPFAPIALLGCIVGFTVYGGVSIYDKTLKADKPKAPNGTPEPYDNAKVAAKLRAQGANISVAPRAPAAPAPLAPGTPLPAGVTATMPAGVALASDDNVTTARNQISQLNTRYQDAINRERQLAATQENSRSS